MYVMSLLKLRLLHFYKLMLFANGRVTKRGFVGLGWIAFWTVGRVGKYR